MSKDYYPEASMLNTKLKRYGPVGSVKNAVRNLVFSTRYAGKNRRHPPFAAVVPTQTYDRIVGRTNIGRRSLLCSGFPGEWGEPALRVVDVFDK
jgi:hypothetical protein